MALGRRPFDRLPTSSLSLGTPLALLTLASIIGSALSPGLLAHHPLVLIALAPRTMFLVAAAPHVGLTAFVVVGTVRLAVADPFHFALGRRFLGHRLDRHRAVVTRLGLPIVAVHPTGPVLAAAGATGLRPISVAVADVAGTLVQVAVLHELGRTVSVPGGLWMLCAGLAAGTVGLGAAGLRALVRRRRRARPARHTRAAARAKGGDVHAAAPRTAPRLRTRGWPSPRSRPATGSSSGTAPAPLLPVAASTSA